MSTSASQPSTNAQIVDESLEHAAPDTAVAHQELIRPFFTLIEDIQTGEHHHPRVYYIFDDDDQSIITHAACQSIEDLEQSTNGTSGSITEEGPASVRQHNLVVDVNVEPPSTSIASPSYTISSIESMSSDWQVSNVNVTDAPTMGVEGGDGRDSHTMLKIAGLGRLRDHQATIQGRGSITDTIERLMQQMREIQTLVERDGDSGKQDIGL